jgi:hypothetical protein
MASVALGARWHNSDSGRAEERTARCFHNASQKTESGAPVGLGVAVMARAAAALRVHKEAEDRRAGRIE